MSERRTIAEISEISDVTGTFIAVTGPPGSGKASLVNRVIQDKEK
jgi:putative protein kinase ArgK-like GTPase of G3E family